jgi:4-amino-4-deoxy-L-arabinose transferase-like glycosyltransferase
MEFAVRTSRLLTGAVFALAAALVLIGIWSFGIWDPWELSAADIARRLAAGEAPTDGGALRIPPLAPWLVAQGFALFGIHEWSGRIPIAVTGLVTVGLAYGTVARFAGARAGIYAAIITTTSPLFLLNARQMVGAAPGFATSALVFLCAASLVFQPQRADSPPLRRPVAQALWGAGLGLAVVLATLASGFLVGALPPLAAVAAVAIARGELARERAERDRVRWAIAVGLVALVVAAAVHVGRTIAADAEGYSAWLGGAPRGGSPPSFEFVLEQVFHSFAPWSALVPIAIGRAFAGQAKAEDARPATDAEEPALRLALPLWAIFGFCAQTIYLSRYGQITFLPVVALAGSIALFLRDVERSGRGSAAAGIVTLLLALLLVRDFRGYPVVPASGLALEGLSAPDVFNPAAAWAGVLGAFGLLALLGLSVDREESFARFRADLQLAGARWAEGLGARTRVLLGVAALGWARHLLREQWARGLAFRAWLVAFGLLALSCTLFGILCLVFGDSRPYGALSVTALVSIAIAGLAWVGLAGLGIRHAVLARRGPGGTPPRWIGRSALALTIVAAAATASALAAAILGSPAISSLAVRIGRVLAFLVPGLVVTIALARAARFGFHKLGSLALVPMLAAGVAVGGYASWRWQPALSVHFSPREVYDTYNELALPGEPLGEWQVGRRAAAYYARGEVRELRDQAQVLEFLAQPSRVWLVFRADDLAQLNRAYRQRSGRHLFVVDASSARVLLATNVPLERRASQNYLADAVLDEAPSVQFPVGANYDRRIELIGYDLDLPGRNTVGPGQQFAITWYWRCLAPVPGNYQVFVHIDGMGQRLNGDHEPVGGRYPVRLWDEGDVVVDRQELRVPANFPPGTYTIFVGFYAGETRLDVVSGPQDEVDRVRAGTLLVR